VLRSEFKKLVNDMHTKFESELAREQNERRRLENLVKIYEERSNEIGP
jgi:Sec-independent protein translocase protein TatA